MVKSVFVLPHRVKVRLRREARKSKDPGFRDRCRMVLHAGRQRSSRYIAEALGVSRSWVSRVIRRFEQDGMTGLVDRREDNGTVKVDDWYLKDLEEVVGGSPKEYGYQRPTWTRELLVAVMEARVERM